MKEMSNRHILFEGQSARIERDEDGTCREIQRASSLSDMLSLGDRNENAKNEDIRYDGGLR